MSGVVRVLAHLGMIDDADVEPPPDDVVESRSSRWVRAVRTGILRLECHLGDRVAEHDRLGVVANSFGKSLRVVRAPTSGIVIGRSTSPIVNQGDALVHIAEPW